ncbi:MAG: hypothetical protein RLZZ21_88 [Planctomycetota bacterium]
MPRKTLSLERRRRLYKCHGSLCFRVSGLAEQGVNRHAGAQPNLHAEGVGNGAGMPHCHGGLSPKDSRHRRGLRSALGDGQKLHGGQIRTRLGMDHDVALPSQSLRRP